jgi:serine protease
LSSAEILEPRSLSLGGGGMSSALSDLLTELYQNDGFLIFAASGNDGQNVKMYPAAHPLVVAVGAVMQNSSIWPSSDYGPWLELCAPGKSVYSTTVNAQGQSIYAYYSGTSMATPHAAGVAALVWSHFPECSNTEIRIALANSARDTGPAGCDDYAGFGIVQAKNAIDWIITNPCSGKIYNTTTIEGGCTFLQTLSG